MYGASLYLPRAFYPVDNFKLGHILLDRTVLPYLALLIMHFRRVPPYHVLLIMDFLRKQRARIE